MNAAYNTSCSDDTVMNSRVGWHSHFFVEDLGLVLAAKLCPGQSQTFRKVNNGQALGVSVGRTHCLVYIQPFVYRYIYIQNKTVLASPRHVCKKSLRKYKKNYRQKPIP